MMHGGGWFGLLNASNEQPEVSWALLRRVFRYAAAASLSGGLDMAARASGPNGTGEHKARLERVFGDLSAVPGSRHDLFSLASKVKRSRGPKPALFACCGTEDFLYQQNVNFRDQARKLGLDLTYEEGPGEHNWAFWDKMIQNVLAWLPK